MPSVGGASLAGAHQARELPQVRQCVIDGIDEAGLLRCLVKVAVPDGQVLQARQCRQSGRERDTFHFQPSQAAAEACERCHAGR